MTQLQAIGKLPPRALGFGFWWMWIYLAILSPTFAQSPFSAQPLGGPMFSLMTIASGAVVYALAVPAALCWPHLFQKAAITWGAAIVASLSAVAMAFSALFGDAGSTVFVAGSLLGGVGISVIFLQWGAYYARLEPAVVTPCTILSFLLAIVAAALVLDRGIMTSVIIVLIPLGAAALLPVAEPEDIQTSPGQSAAAADRNLSLELRDANPFSASVIALILVFSSGFGLFRVLLATPSPSNHDMGLLLLCSAAMAFVLLAIIVAFSVSLGWDSVIYLALPLIAAASLVLSVVDFGDRSFVWAIIVAAVRVADLIMWIIFAQLARSARRSPVAVFAFGKLMAQIGVILGMVVAQALSVAFDTETLLLPTALAFLVLVTLFGSSAAIRGRIERETDARRNPDGTCSQPDIAAGFADVAPTPVPEAAGDPDASLAAIAADHGLSPRETEIFELLAKGRSIPYIADELVLANSTVTTHVRGLYRKLDVHNRQELLDLVEERS